MRRVSELIYTIAFFGFGIWALSSGLITLFSGLEDLTTTGTWASALMVMVGVSLRTFGEVTNKHTKTLIFVGMTALFGGMWGIGTVFIILSGILMIIRGFQQIKVLREQPSLKELRQIRKERLEEVADEEVEYREVNDTEKSVVPEDLLEGFIGSDDYNREVHTWIDKREFDRRELTPEEVIAREKQEIRENSLSLETLIALGELGVTSESSGDVDLTNIDLDLPAKEEAIVESTYLEDEIEEPSYREEGSDRVLTQADIEGISLEDLLGE